MKPEEIRHVAQAMGNRARQRNERLCVAAVVALVFSDMVGVGVALTWFAVYALLQVFEDQFAPGGRVARRLDAATCPVACVIVVFISSCVFGSLGVFQVLSEAPLSVAGFCLMLGGSTINAVMISPGSRALLLAAFLPQVLLAILLPILLLAGGHPVVGVAQVAVGSALLLAAGLATWSNLAASFRATQEAQRLAEDANRAKSDFLATMSHEIRTPLNGVLGMAQAMAADELSERQRERLDVVTQSGQSLLTILSDVLDLAKIEARKLELELAAFDLEDLVERSQETFRAIADSKGLGFETRIDKAAVGTWRGDTTRLRQVLSNLISNAVKFTDEGRVTVMATTAEGRLRFVVEDTGPGVTPEQLPRLFKKFVQADASTTRRYGGTGLGLSICGELAMLMGGSITAEHVEPHGLRFTFDAPVERIDAERRPSSAAAVGARDYEGVDDRVLRVLAAEDHPVNRQVLTLLLSQAGIIPHIVENGAEAVQAWRDGAVDGPWDLILMDVQMPIMDGPTAARTIRAEEKAAGRPPVPIIALTANVMTHQIEEYRQAGMDTFVAKPIQVRLLLDGIETALARVPVEDAQRAA